MDRQKKKNTKNRFDLDASAYDERIVKHVNGYLEMHEALLNFIPFAPSARLSVLDLGIGCGRLDFEILKRFPNAKLMGLDFSEKMIATAQHRLKNFSGRVRLQNTDFEHGLPNETFDVIIMVLSLHHLEDKNKAKLIKRLYHRLKKRGALLIGDLTKSRSPRITNIYMDLWRANLRANGYSEDYIAECYHEKYEIEDIPATIEDHLSWLKKAKFNEIEVFWKRYHFVALGGFKGKFK